ncbi:F-box/LRR-repeat protein 25-like [Bidens hawaiensis]|uniref:F-box/LRR-repeat protein 25-like n=1 Tax=Bidens hawaiensis TaxID=980011 RepID=UPI00404B64D3
MTKESQNQPLKPIRFEDEDGISKLPDCLLVEILSRLPQTKHAVRTGTLSKRWKHIWHQVPNLIFVYADEDEEENPDFISFVDKALTQRRQLKLKKFEVTIYTSCCYISSYESHIHNWVRYAVNCNVEELHLGLWCMEIQTEFPVDQFVFISSCFTYLKFSGCLLNPTMAISWKNLRTLCISDYCKLDEGLIQNILSGSPVLETLVLDKCHGCTRLNITSKSVKNLVFNEYTGRHIEDIIETNAPNILSLTYKSWLMIRKLLLLNVSSLVEVDINYWHGTTDELEEEETLERFLLKLRHVKVLKIGRHSFKVLKRLEAKGFIRPSNLKVLSSP